VLGSEVESVAFRSTDVVVLTKIAVPFTIIVPLITSGVVLLETSTGPAIPGMSFNRFKKNEKREVGSNATSQ
jgi:hypothetical protein